MEKSVNKNSDDYLDIELVRKLRRERKYEELYNLLKDKHEKNPYSDFILTQYLLSIISFKPNDCDLLKEVIDKLAITDRQDFFAFGNVMYYLSINDPKEASIYYKEVKGNTFFVNVIFAHLYAYKSSKEFRELVFDVDQAIMDLTNPRLATPKYVLKAYDIGDYYYDQRNFVEAIKYYTLSLDKRIESKKAVCYYKIGKCYFQISDYEKFNINFKQALELCKTYSTKDYYKVLYDYIYSLIEFSRFDMASELTKELDTGSRKDRVMSIFLRGRILKKTGNTENAIKVFESLLSEGGIDRRNALIELCKSYGFIGNYEKAKMYMNALYSEYPDFSPIYKVSFYYDFGEYENAIEEGLKYIDTKFSFEAKYYIGRSLNRLRRFDEAIKYLEDIRGLVGNSPYYFELAFAYDKMGEFEEAYICYKEYININIKRNDKSLFNKGLISIIEFLSSQYMFDEVNKYISIYENNNPDDIDNINFIKGEYYYRKQDFETSEQYFKKLYGTELENKAKNYLIILYRYISKVDEANKLIDELERTDLYDQVQYNKSKQLKDRHTKQSLEQAYNILLNIEDEDIRNMVYAEKIQILSKLGKYDVAYKLVEEAHNEYSISHIEYLKYKYYLAYKLGYVQVIDPNYKDRFLGLVQRYTEESAIEKILNMKAANEDIKDLYLSDDEIVNIYHTVRNNLDNYDYYISSLYDIYVVDMGKIVGNFHGIDTRFLEIKCEINTNKIHIIQPTLKRINVNTYDSKKRVKTDLE